MQLLTFDNTIMIQKLDHMLKFSTHIDEIKEYAKHAIKKRDDMHVKTIVDKDEALNENFERDIEEKLKKWRFKERKREFVERINQLNIKEMLPK